MGEHISEAVIRRLPGYYRHLRELEVNGIKQVSSQELGERMDQTPSLVRQDINSFGGFGRQGYGYDVSALKNCIGSILHLHEEHRMIIVGAGHIGTAVARYPSFMKEGFHTLAMFDSDPEKIGQMVDDIPILELKDLEMFVRLHEIDIAVLALPGRCAQGMLERLENCGIHAIWNFAPVDLIHDKNVTTVVNVHMSDSLQVLSYKMAHRIENEDEGNERSKKELRDEHGGEHS